NPGVSGRQTLEILACAARLPRRRVDDALEQVGLAGRADDLVKAYSLGMRQIRELIRRLGTEGRTIFLSSHLLAEVEQVCDRVAIVARGRTVKSGPIADVLAAARPTAVSVKVRNLRGGAQTLQAAGFRVALADHHLEVAVHPARADRVTRALVAQGHYPSELRPVETSLEDAFFALTGDAAGDAS